jgi:hypothetical protein
MGVATALIPFRVSPKRESRSNLSRRAVAIGDNAIEDALD